MQDWSNEHLPQGCRKILWVDTEEGAKSALTDMLSEGKPSIIYLDTEFERTKTFFPIASLLQLRVRSTVYIFDLTQLDTPECYPAQFIELFKDPYCLKVFHSGREDIDLLDQLWGIQLSPVLDTQWAANFLLPDAQLGLAALLEKMCGLVIDKSSTRSDWLQRPLDEAQFQYAVNDVWYLEQLYDRLFTQLHDACIWDEVFDDCQWIYPVSAECQLKTVLWRADAWRFSDRALKRLAALHLWRDEFVRGANVPKSWAGSDRGLSRLALLEKKKLYVGNHVTHCFKGEHQFIKRYLKQEKESMLSALDEAEMLWAAEIAKAGNDAGQLNGMSGLVSSGLVSIGTQLQVPPIGPMMRPVLHAMREEVERVSYMLNWRADQLCRKKWLNEWLRTFLYCAVNGLPFHRALLSNVWMSWRGDHLMSGFEKIMSQFSGLIASSVNQLREEKGTIGS